MVLADTSNGDVQYPSSSIVSLLKSIIPDVIPQELLKNFNIHKIAFFKEPLDMPE